MEETLKFKKLLVAGIVTSIIAQMSFAQASFYSETGTAVTLTILHNNDGESALLPDQ